MGGFLRRGLRRSTELELVVAAADAAVRAGQYPTILLALSEMAANQRKATRLNVDIRDLLMEAGR